MQPRSQSGWQKPQLPESLPVCPRVYISRKLESGAGVLNKPMWNVGMLSTSQKPLPVWIVDPLALESEEQSHIADAVWTPNCSLLVIWGIIQVQGLMSDSKCFIYLDFLISLFGSFFSSEDWRVVNHEYFYFPRHLRNWGQARNQREIS